MADDNKPVDLNDDQLDSVTGGAGIGALATNGLNVTSIQGMDLETALMAVQSQRVNLLDGQLQDQLSQVQARNDQMVKLNDALTVFTQTVAGAPGAKPDQKVTDAQGFALNKYGVSTSENLMDDFAKIGMDPDKARNLSLGDLKDTVANMRATMDSLNSSQQLDMVRLQSLSNKQNEAFDVMTNFVKQMQDSRASIIGNMR